MKRSDDLVHPRAPVTIILTWITKKQDVSVDWINVAQDRVHWRALENMAMELRVP
jgi:hypothetical protein